MKTTGNFGILLCFCMMLFSCKDAEQKNRQQGMVVRVTQAVKPSEGNQKEFSFISKPFRTSELSFRVGGPIKRFEVYAGTYYKRGEVIAEIDPRDFRIRKERMEAQYNQAKAEYERIEVLYRKNNVSASTFEKAKAEYISAKTAYETAMNELNDTRLVAPFDGYVGEVYIEEFQDVKASQPVISFVDLGQLKLEAYVTQEIAFGRGNVREVELEFDAMPGKTYKAKVEEISKSTTSNNLSYLLTALLPNREEHLPAGMSGKLFLRSDGALQQAGVIVPQKAVCHRPVVGDYVWTLNADGNRVSRKNVTLGTLLPGGEIAVVDGLEAGETIVVSGLRFLSENMAVQVADEKRI